VLKISVSSVVDQDPDQSDGWIRMKVISWIRIRINLQTPSQNARNMSLFENFFKVFEARIHIRKRIKVTRIRIRIRINMMWIRNTVLYNISPKMMNMLRIHHGILDLKFKLIHNTGYFF
jgi:hypothetical protein